MAFEEYSLEDFKHAIGRLGVISIDLDYDSFITLAAQMLGNDLIKELTDIESEEAILASFANGLVIGILVAELKYKPKDPLITH